MCRTISTIRDGGFPRQSTTSGNPRRRSRWESTLAKPRSSYGRSRSASITSPTLTVPPFKSRRSDSTRCRSKGSPDLFPLFELEHGTQRATPLDLLADPVLPLEDVERAVRHLDGLFARHDDQPGLVPHDPVAHAHFLAAALDLAPDFPEALRLARMGGHMAAEAGEVQLEDRVEVPYGAVDHDPGHALHEAGGRRELPPDRGRPTADIDHDHVPGIRAVDRLHGLRPIPVRRLDGHGRSDEFRPVPDPGDEARHHAALLHRIREVRRGDLPESVADIRIRVLLVKARRDRFPLEDRFLDRARCVGHVLRFDDCAADDDDRGARLQRLAYGLRIQATRHGDRERRRRRHRLQLLEWRVRDPPFLYPYGPVLIVHTQPFQLLCPGRLFGTPRPIPHHVRSQPP